MVRAMCGVQLNDRKRAKDLIVMLGNNDQMAMANSVCWHGHVLRRALDFEVEGQRKKWRLKLQASIYTFTIYGNLKKRKSSTPSRGKTASI